MHVTQPTAPMQCQHSKLFEVVLQLHFSAVTKKFWNSINLLIRKDRVHFLMYFRLGLLQGKLAKCNFVLSGCIRWWVAGGFCQGLFQSSLPSFSRKEPFLKVSFILRFFLPFLGYFMDPSKLFVENYTCGTKINEGDNFFGYHNYIEKFLPLMILYQLCSNHFYVLHWWLLAKIKAKRFWQVTKSWLFQGQSCRVVPVCNRYLWRAFSLFRDTTIKERLPPTVSVVKVHSADYKTA